MIVKVGDTVKIVRESGYKGCHRMGQTGKVTKIVTKGVVKVKTGEKMEPDAGLAHYIHEIKLAKPTQKRMF